MEEVNVSENYTTVKDETAPEVPEVKEEVPPPKFKRGQHKSTKGVKHPWQTGERNWQTRIHNTDEKVESLIEAVTQLTQIVKDIKDPPKPVKPVKRDLEEETLPVPRLWREKAVAILGEEFEFKIDDTANGDFILKIILPASLDRRVGEKMGERDISTGIVRRVSPLLDIETWCERVKANILKTFPNFKPLITK